LGTVVPCPEDDGDFGLALAAEDSEQHLALAGDGAAVGGFAAFQACSTVFVERKAPRSGENS